MSRLHFILPAAAALALAAFIPTPANAFAQAQGAADSPSPTIAVRSQEHVNLSPITVYGQHMPFVVALQMYKKALTRTWSTDPADRDKLVCQ
ncbi:MAG: hypothetical protein L0I62_03750 [Gammaproteobacteria bacterium]|nr:hypothetical protein [Gammaproteobacteria bacterium]